MKNRIRELRKERKITMKQLGQIVGLAESTISQYENDKRQPDNETLLKFAEYFGVSVEYLLGMPAKSPTSHDLNKKDQRDISKALESTLAQLEDDQTGLMFDGEPLDDVTRELLESSLRHSIEMAKRLAKEKYTPKKYK